MFYLLTCTCVYVLMPTEAKGGHKLLWNLSYGRLQAIMWVLRTEPGSSATVLLTLSHLSSSSFIFLKSYSGLGTFHWRFLHPCASFCGLGLACLWLLLRLDIFSLVYFLFVLHRPRTAFMSFCMFLSREVGNLCVYAYGFFVYVEFLFLVSYWLIKPDKAVFPSLGCAVIVSHVHVNETYSSMVCLFHAFLMKALPMMRTEMPLYWVLTLL